MARRAAWRTDFEASAVIYAGGFGLRIILPIIPPSANVLKRKFGRQIASSIRKATTDIVGELLLANIRMQRGLWRNPGKCRVVYCIYRAKVLDDENVGGGTKPITDALVELGILKDDSPEWLELTHFQIPTKLAGMRRTEIVIESL